MSLIVSLNEQMRVIDALICLKNKFATLCRHFILLEITANNTVSEDTKQNWMKSTWKIQQTQIDAQVLSVKNYCSYILNQSFGCLVTLLPPHISHVSLKQQNVRTKRSSLINYSSSSISMSCKGKRKDKLSRRSKYQTR